MSEKQAKGIEKQEKLAQLAEVQTVKEKKRKSENNKCCRYRVNYSHKGRPCPTLNETCANTVTRKAISQKYIIQKQIKFHERQCNRRKRWRSIHRWRINTLTVSVSIPCVTKYSRTDIIIGDKTCLIDSGAGVNVIDTCSFNQLNNMHLQPTSKNIYSYRSTKLLPVVGKFEAEIKLRVTSKSTVTQWMDGNLIGYTVYQTATDLGLLLIMNIFIQLASFPLQRAHLLVSSWSHEI